MEENVLCKGKCIADIAFGDNCETSIKDRRDEFNYFYTLYEGYYGVCRQLCVQQRMYMCVSLMGVAANSQKLKASICILNVCAGLICHSDANKDISF